MSDYGRNLGNEAVALFFVGRAFEIEIQHSHSYHADERDDDHDFRKGHSSAVVSGQQPCGANDLQNI